MNMEEHKEEVKTPNADPSDGKEQAQALQNENKDLHQDAHADPKVKVLAFQKNDSIQDVVKQEYIKHEVTRTKTDQFRLNSWAIIIFLVVVFVVLKKFIYLPDKKRDGK